jgi:hypothetical protein
MRFIKFFNQHNLKAAAIHLGISAVIAGIILFLVYGIWYPAPLSEALGVTDIFLMLLGIDLTLGPLLTLIVYKPLKKTLKFDLAVIACVQLAALLYGLHTVGSGRPAYMVFTKDRFDLVLAYEVANIGGTSAKPETIVQNPWTQPLFGYKTLAATIPTDVASYPLLNLLTGSALGGGLDIPNIVNFHRPYLIALPLIQKTGKPIANLTSTDAITQTRYTSLRAKYPADSLAVPLKIKYTIYTVIVQPSTGAILGIEPFDVVN